MRGQMADELWRNRRRPNRHDSQQEEIPPNSSALQRFKDALRANEPPGSIVDYFSEAPPDIVNKLTVPSAELSFPLNLFNDSISLPTAHEIAMLRNVFFDQFQSKCYYLNRISSRLFLAQSSHTTLAVSSIGCIAESDIPRSNFYWDLAIRALLATINVDNSQTRKSYILVSWLPIAAIGALSRELTSIQIINNLCGIMETIVSRLIPNTDNLTSTIELDDTERVHTMLYLLLVDTVRSLHFGTMPITLSSVERLPLGTTHNSLAHLSARTLFGTPTSQWPEANSENALLVLLLILNHIISWARDMTPVAEEVCRSIGSITDSEQNCGSARTETNSCRVRIQRALRVWEKNYHDVVAAEIKALYYFCRIYMLLPDLFGLSEQAGYPLAEYFNPKVPTHTNQRPSATVATMQQAASYAWLVFENTTESADMSAIWLPVTLYFAGLVVWSDVKAQGNSRCRGSLQVLRLFESKLKAMRWPCCAAMAQNLDQLISITAA